MGFSWEMPSQCTRPSPGSLAHSQDVNCAQALLIGCEQHMVACSSQKPGFCSLEEWNKAGGEKGEVKRERD